MKVLLRNFKECDTDILFAIRRNSTLQHMLMAYPEASTTKNPEEWLKSHTTNINNFFQVISLQDTNQCIGFVQIVDIHNIAKYGYFAIAIHQDFQNKGYGHHALSQLINVAKKELLLYKLILNVLVKNTAAIKLYTKYDFHTVGVYKNHYPVHELRHDVLIMEKIL